MELIANLSLGLSVAFHPSNLIYCFLGVLLGTLVGVLPGLGPLATIAMLLPLTFGLEPTTALIMLAGIYYGSQYGGSTTAILVNLPGESASAVTTIDGYHMTLQGRAGPALATAAIGSFVAGTFATVLIALVAKPLTSIALSFGPAEYFSLMVLGLISSISLSSGSFLKAIAMICLGLLLGLSGTDIYTAIPRFTFGAIDLLDGIDFVALAVGIYGIGEILRNLESDQNARAVIGKVKNIWPTREDLARIAAPIVRGTAIGSILGVLPGGGALLSSFIAYNVEKRTSRNSAQFGKGAIEGVAAPEAANNAGAQTSFIPMLALGIPSNALMALMVGAMVMQGVVPGPNVIVRNPDLFWGLIVSMWIGNAMLVVLNLPLIGLWVSLLRIPYSILFPAIVALCCIGVYSINNSSFAVYLVAVFGLLGYVLRRFDCEPAPFILGFILGPMLEEHLRRAMLMSGGDLKIFVASPISCGLLTVSALALFLVSRPSIDRQRKEVFAGDNE
ncbi:tripartite tricarboxylate transporter permease [Sinorhizobium medicae]|uniref:tripartite tricarboxylate transporter permease n=1 Tax=Sinorhizobium medicae TaxID=110321 RepID=UPI000FD7B922|nr:tripartite tricarboxylate transporter permease [Sinorhizobium medicae]RVO73539.1 tripartite tricarboxylate transporter permease [Sinorhizobium medicae]